MYIEDIGMGESKRGHWTKLKEQVCPQSEATKKKKKARYNMKLHEKIFSVSLSLLRIM